MGKLLGGAMLAACLTLTAGSARADLYDFSDPANFSAYNGKTSFTVNEFLSGIDMVVSAYTITWAGEAGASDYVKTGAGTMYADHWRSDGDWGLGINEIYPGTGAYEVGVNELLEITFLDSLTGAPTPVLLESVNLALFFANESQGGVTYDETGFYGFNGTGSLTQMQAVQTIQNPATDGKYTITANQVINSLQLFGGLGSPAADERKSEYKVQGVAATGVPSAGTPEPATMLLLGSAMGLVGVYRRRSRKL